VIRRLLRPAGVAFLMAPTRGHSFHAFAAMAASYFSVTIEPDYDAVVSSMRTEAVGSNPAFSQDLHYPFLLTLRPRVS
jgi:hypothetical protein